MQGGQGGCTGHIKPHHWVSVLSLPTLSWSHCLTLSHAFASYSFPPYNFPFVLPILLFHSIPPHSVLSVSFGRALLSSLLLGSTYVTGFHLCTCPWSTCMQILTHFYSLPQTWKADAMIIFILQMRKPSHLTYPRSHGWSGKSQDSQLSRLASKPHPQSFGSSCLSFGP